MHKYKILFNVNTLIYLILYQTYRFCNVEKKFIYINGRKFSFACGVSCTSIDNLAFLNKDFLNLQFLYIDRKMDAFRCVDLSNQW